MSPPISSTVKERLIQLHLEGKDRNEIAQTLKLFHIRISQGSVTNILRAYEANTSQAPTKTTTDFPQASEPSPPPSHLQTSPTSEMKTQIPVSEGPSPEPLSIADAKGPEEPGGPEVPIAPATSTPAATVATSPTSIPSSSFLSSSPIPEALPYLAGVNFYPYLYSQFNLGYLNPQISEALVNPVCLHDSEKETTHEEAQEVQVQDQSSEVQDQEQSFMDLGWSTVFEEVMEVRNRDVMSFC
jgi:hypothetical protein